MQNNKNKGRKMEGKNDPEAYVRNKNKYKKMMLKQTWGLEWIKGIKTHKKDKEMWEGWTKDKEEPKNKEQRIKSWYRIRTIGKGKENKWKMDKGGG